MDRFRTRSSSFELDDFDDNRFTNRGKWKLDTSSRRRSSIAEGGQSFVR
jgi:hypothetical protein